jgi:hypothetical protein
LLLRLRDGDWLAVAATGHSRASPGAERDLVYAAVTDQGQQTLTAEEFTEKYGWKNDPKRVRLAGR